MSKQTPQQPVQPSSNQKFFGGGGSSANDPINVNRRLNSELFTLTYGSLITQLIKDYESTEAVNKQLERLGYNIGIRLIEDFLARSPTAGRCVDLRESAERVQSAIKLYTPLNPSLTNITSEEFSLLFDNCHPFAEFAELPDNCQELKYCNVLVGCIKGALNSVQMEVQCWIEKDFLKGDSCTEVKVRFVRKLVDALPAGED